MLDQLRAGWRDAPKPATLDRAIRELSARLGELGTFNLLLNDSRSLYCYCSSRLALLTRRAPFGRATLIDEDLKVDFARETTPNDVVTVVATRPLTSDERWTELERGRLLVLRDGEVIGGEVVG
jgi:glutamine amidotransferase